MRAKLLGPVLAALFLAAASGCAPRVADAPAEVVRTTPGPQPRVILIVLAPSRLPNGVQEPQDDQPALCGGDDEGLEGEGLFVQVPARIGAFVFFVPGFLIGSPAFLLVPFSDVDHSGGPLAIPFLTGGFTGIVGYYLVGGPFWVVKKVAWDGPRAFGRWLNLAARSRKGQVDYLANLLVEKLWYDQGNPYRQEVCRKLEQLTGEKPKPKGKDWWQWWQLHRDEFDRSMKRIRPAAPEPKPEAPPAPIPVPATQGA
jgi:hypothetical protein